MSAIHIINKAKDAGVFLYLDNGRLAFKSQGELSDALKAEIVAKRDEVMALLGSYEQAAETMQLEQPKAKRRHSSEKRPVSYEQQRMLVLDSLLSDKKSYNMTAFMTLSGMLDSDALEMAVNDLVAAHEVLRTCYRFDHSEYYGALQSDVRLSLPSEDLTSLSLPERDARLEALNRESADIEFDLAQDIPLHLKLVKVAAEEHRLYITLHHIAFDDVSMAIFCRQLSDSYNRAAGHGEMAKTALPLQYADYADFQRSQLDVHRDRLESFWQEQLDQLPLLHDLPLDYVRPATLSSAGKIHSAHLSAEHSRQILSLAEHCQTTVFALLQSVFAVFLHRYSGAEDIVVGTPVNNRSHSDFNALIGLFVNTVVLRSAINPEASFEDFLKQNSAAITRSVAHSLYPFDLLVETLNVERSMSYNPLFQIVFVYQDERQELLDLNGLACRIDEMHTDTAKFDLVLTLSHRNDGLTLRWEYPTDLFDPQSIEGLSHSFIRVLESVCHTPSQAIRSIALLNDGEKSAILASAQAQCKPCVAEHSLVQLFDAQADKRSQKTALAWGDSCLSYAGLKAAADRLAAQIVATGVAPGAKIGIVAEPCFEMIVGVLGVLKAGCAYVPVDPASPQARIRYIAQDAALGAVLATDNTAALVADICDIVLPITLPQAGEYSATLTLPEVRPSDLAYVIYTSGSTGQPKGVEIEHGNVVRLFSTTDRQFGFGPEDVWTLFHSFAFDFSVWEIWGALLFGGKLIVLEREQTRDSEAFYRLVAERQVTVLNQTPTAFNQFIAADQRLSQTLALRYVIFGGEALNLVSLRPWLDRHGERTPQLINMYGITETTVHVTYKHLSAQEITSGRGSLIGQPLDDLTLYLLDSALQPVPDGVVAELYVAGGGLARGYLNRPKLTAERFITSPFAPHERLYRTGDLACRLPSGEFRYHGRCDQQVKIRGFRIETGEIEHALLQHPMLREAVVLVHQSQSSPQLVAYVVTEPSDVDSARLQQILRQHLSTTLAEYMIPALFVRTQSIPLTTNGKVARDVLPKPDFSALVQHHYVAPGNALQRQLCEIWQRTLDLSRVGIEDNFFALGGDSIRVIGMVAAANAAGIGLAAKDVFTHQTIARLSAHLKPLSERPVVAQAPAAFSLLNQAQRAYLEGQPNVDSLLDAYPLTELQKGMVFHSQREADKGTYHDIMCLQLAVAWHEAHFVAALDSLVAQHDILRTRFVLGGDVMLQLVEKAVRPALEVIDLRHYSASEAELRVAEWMAQEKYRPFDYDHILWKVTVHLLGDNEIHYSLTCHHAIMDGWSVATFNSELFTRYRRECLGQHYEVPKGLPFSGHVAEQMAAEGSSEAKAYWQRTLEDAALPWWHRSESGRIAIQPVAVDASLSDAFTRLARQMQLPEQTLFLAAHLYMLAFLNGKRDIVTSVVTHRRPAVAGGDTALGLFLNALPLRLTLGEVPWRQWVSQVQQQLADMADFSDYPLANVQKDSGLDFSSSLFNFTHFHSYNELSESIALVKEDSFTETNYAFASQFSRNVTTGRYELLLELDSQVFDPAFAQRIARYYQTILRSLAEHPDEVADHYAVLGREECQSLKQQLERPPVPHHPDQCIHTLFEAAVQKHPEKVALSFDGQTLTYRALNQKANQLAHMLLDKGIGKESLVGLCLERSLEMVVAIYGILKAGAAYVPLDPQAPPKRLQTMVAASGISLVVTSCKEVSMLTQTDGELLVLDSEQTLAALSGYPVEDIDAALLSLTPDNLAYVIHTSGSTGTPKGVMVEHAALVNRIGWMNRAYPLAGDDVVLQKTPFSFDVSVWEFIWPLAYGASLVIAKPDGHKDPYYLAQTIAANRVTILHFVPSMLRAFLSSGQGEGCDTLRLVICSGEALPDDLVVDFQNAMSARLENLYGPTEAAIDVTSWDTRQHSEAKTVPIGYPIDNIQIHILNEAGKPMPKGCPGELYIGGVGLARGYRNREDLTDEKFRCMDDPLFGGRRLYQSGDLAVICPQGEIEYLGRIDDQVKLKGFRIELQEIECQIAAFSPDAHGVVLVKTVHAEKQLVAFVSGIDDVEALREFLYSRLNEYMVPRYIKPVQSIPLSSNGKVNRKALAAMTIEFDNEQVQYVAPSSTIEKTLVAVYAEVLGCAKVGVRDNFFSLGGDSIRCISLVAGCRAKDVAITIEDVYQHPQIEQLAAVLASRQEVAQEAVLVAPLGLLSEDDRRKVEEGTQEVYPLTTLQKGLVLESQLASGSAMYHDIVVYTVDDTLDLDAFSEALAAVQQRHGILRTCFDWDTFSEPMQVVREGQCNALQWLDLTALLPTEQAQALSDFLDSEKRHEFDWRAPLIRYFIHQLSDRRYQFTLSFHDSMLDGWSINALSSEIFDRYFANRDAQPLAHKYSLPVLPFRQYVSLEMAALRSEQDKDWWCDKLADFTFSALPFSGDEPQDSVRYADVELAPGVSEGLLSLAEQLGVPVKIVLLSAHMRVLAFISGQYNVISGLEQNGRPEMADSERTLGLFLNTLPLRVSLQPGSWKDLVRQVFDEEIALMPHRHYPMAQMRLDNGIGELFEVVFNYVHFHVSQQTIAEHGQSLVQLDSVLETEYPLRAEFSRDTQQGEVALSLHYNPRRIGEDELADIRYYYQQVLQALATDSDADWLELSLLTRQQHRQLMHRWNDTDCPLPSALNIHQLLDRQAKETPTRIAVTQGQRQLNYRQLSADSTRIALALQAQGVKPGDVVALYSTRSIEFLAVMLGIFKAGGVYLPLDVNHPADRVRLILTQCQSRLVVTDTTHAAALAAVATEDTSSPEQVLIEDLLSYESTDESLAIDYDGSDLAYIIFTSGSTGVPKGAMVEHIGLINHIYAKMRDLSLGAADIVAQNASQCFDISIWQFLSPLVFGGIVSICPDEVALDARSLVNTIDEQGISILELVPSVLKEMLNLLEDDGGLCRQLAHLRWLVPTGEALPPLLARQWLALFPHVPIVNAYGPTECSDDITHYPISTPPDEQVVNMPIGRPVINMRMYILDSRQKMVPVGTAGELYVSGIGVGPGYINNPQKTAEAFIDNPFDDGYPRMYRTGDLARYLKDGVIEFLGRVDHQVKIRGFRIELGEIEANLRRYPEVDEVVIAVVENGQRDKQLVAWLSLKNRSEAEIAECYGSVVEALTVLLQENLPQYMIPAHFVLLTSLPHLANGKINRKALPDHRLHIPAAVVSVAPQTPLEHQMAALWLQNLNLERIGMDDNFFNIGGHSLMAMRLVNDINKAFDMQSSVKDLFMHPTPSYWVKQVELRQALAVNAETALQSDDDAGIEMEF